MLFSIGTDSVVSGEIERDVSYTTVMNPPEGRVDGQCTGRDVHPAGSPSLRRPYQGQKGEEMASQVAGVCESGRPHIARLGKVGKAGKKR